MLLYLCISQSKVSESLAAPFQIMMVFVSVHLSQVKDLKGSLTLTAYAVFCIPNNYYIAHIIFHTYII